MQIGPAYLINSINSVMCLVTTCFWRREQWLFQTSFWDCDFKEKIAHWWQFAHGLSWSLFKTPQLVSSKSTPKSCWSWWRKLVMSEGWATTTHRLEGGIFKTFKTQINNKLKSIQYKKCEVKMCWKTVACHQMNFFVLLYIVVICFTKANYSTEYILDTNVLSIFVRIVLFKQFIMFWLKKRYSHDTHVSISILL